MSETAPLLKRLLIVDDNATERESLRTLLQADDLEIIEVGSSRELLQRMPELSSDVILLSATLPEISGSEVCRRLKESASYRHIPIVLIAPAGSAIDWAEGVDAGADELITQPVSPKELQARVRTMLRMKMQYDELERLLELRQALSYMIVHDLRNPLAAVMLYLQLMKRKGVGPDQSRYLEFALSESQKMSNFLDDMLMLAKMERGKLQISRSPLSMDRVIGFVREKFEPLAEAQAVTLTTRLPEQPQPLTADVTLLQRVIENLVANALKFAPANSTVTIEVEYPPQNGQPANGQREPGTMVETGGTREKPEKGKRGAKAEQSKAPAWQARISVMDQGRGIPPGDMVRMFDQYEAVFMKEHGKSELGLELAFCRMVMEAHGGRIYAGNNPDRGAVITIEL